MKIFYYLLKSPYFSLDRLVFIDIVSYIEQSFI